MTRFSLAVVACLALVLVPASAASAASNISVVAGAADSSVTAGPNYTATGAGAQIGADNIKAFLDAGTSVTIDTAAGNNGTGTIAVNAAISSAGAGALTLDADDDISQSAAIAINGNVTATTTVNDNVVLTNAGNDFNTISVPSGATESITDVDDVAMGAFSSNGIIDIKAGGTVTQTGPTDAVTLVRFDVGTGNDVLFTHPGNNPNAVRFISVGNATVVENEAVVLNASNITGGSTISDTLTVISGGDITDGNSVGMPPLTVTGATTLTAPVGSDITLDDSLNNFSSVAVTSGNNVTLRDANALDLGASSISGALSVTSAGAITDSGALAVTGGALFTAGAGNNVTLDSVLNNFATVAIGSGNNVSVTDATALDLGASTISGGLTVNTAGAVTQSGMLAVAGTAAFTAGAANNITLNGLNNFSTVAVGSGNNVTVSDANTLALGSSTVSGDLALTAGGALTQTGAATVTGATSAAGAPVTLDNAANDFGGLAAVASSTAGAATVTDANDLTLDSSTSGGDLTVTAADDLTVPGGETVAATGALRLVADNGSPAAPAIGTGGITVGGGAALTGGGAIRLYAARRGDNSIAGTATFNGATFSPGTIFVNSAREQWGVYSPGGTATVPFTFFYKNRDAAAPTITLTSPADGAQYNLGEVVAADYACADETSLASCSGTVADGARLDTSSLGAKTFSVDAADAAGNTATVSRSYTVVLPEGSCRGGHVQDGTSAADSLTGTATGDLIFGDDGDDLIAGLEGVDCLFGEAANDRLFGDDGNDWLWGGPGEDGLHGMAGDDKLRGEADSDYLAGGDDDDGLKGGPGDDRLRGQGGDDYLSGGSGDDRLNGGEGTNRYFARDGDDLIRAQNDVREAVHCGAGDDVAYLDRRDTAFGCEKVRRGD